MRKSVKAFAGLVAGMIAFAVSAPSQAQHNFSGLYIGANAGWAGADINGSFPVVPVNHHDGDHSAAILGGHVGIQHQFGMFVVGVEAGFSSTEAFSGWGDRVAGGSDACLLSNANRACQNRFANALTIGPRLGWVMAPKTMLFVTGGYASARLDSRTINTVNGQDAAVTSNRHDGWFAGIGIEYALTRDWIVGLEYQRISLDSERHFNGLAGGCCVVNISTRDLDAEIDVVRARLSFKLGRDALPAEAMK